MIRTHLGIDAALVGTPQSVEEGRAVVSLTARADMAAALAQKGMLPCVC